MYYGFLNKVTETIYTRRSVAALFKEVVGEGYRKHVPMKDYYEHYRSMSCDSLVEFIRFEESRFVDCNDGHMTKFYPYYTNSFDTNLALHVNRFFPTYRLYAILTKKILRECFDRFRMWFENKTGGVEGLFLSWTMTAYLNDILYVSGYDYVLFLYDFFEEDMLERDSTFKSFVSRFMRNRIREKSSNTSLDNIVIKAHIPLSIVGKFVDKGCRDYVHKIVSSAKKQSRTICSLCKFMFYILRDKEYFKMYESLPSPNAVRFNIMTLKEFDKKINGGRTRNDEKYRMFTLETNVDEESMSDVWADFFGGIYGERLTT